VLPPQRKRPDVVVAREPEAVAEDDRCLLLGPPGPQGNAGPQGAYVSRQLGHADASITLKVYAHLFDAAEHARRASDRLEANFAKVLQSGAAVQPVADRAAQAVNVAPFPVPATGGN
jgi:hypothetical protein